MLAYVNRLFSERYKQWKSDLHQYFETFDDPQVALEEGCPKEFEDRKDNWEWLCSHFSRSLAIGIFLGDIKFKKYRATAESSLGCGGSRSLAMWYFFILSLKLLYVSY